MYYYLEDIVAYDEVSQGLVLQFPSILLHDSEDDRSRAFVIIWIMIIDRNPVLWVCPKALYTAKDIQSNALGNLARLCSPPFSS